jgi:uncharacterized protein (TIGR02117 family)
VQNFSKNKQFNPNSYLDLRMKFLKSIFHFFVFAVQLIFDLVVLYFLFAVIGAFWGRNTDEMPNTDGIPLFIHGDGFHTELYLPVKDSMDIMNWMDWFDDPAVRSKHRSATLVNFAWAEKDWTLAGVENKTPSIQSMLEIAFWPRNKSVMHVQWMDHLWPLQDSFTVKRYLNKQQYLQLIAFIRGSFELKNDKPVVCSYKGYYGWDHLYNSTRNYHSFNTCNQFTSDALNACGIRNASFSPFGWGLAYQLKK